MRKKCQQHGHKWVAYSPGGDPWCARWFCRAKAQAPIMALIERGLRL